MPINFTATAYSLEGARDWWAYAMDEHLPLLIQGYKYMDGHTSYVVYDCTGLEVHRKE